MSLGATLARFAIRFGGWGGGVGLRDRWEFGAFLAGEFFLGGTFVVLVAVEPFVDGLAHDAVASVVLRRVGMRDAGYGK